MTKEGTADLVKGKLLYVEVIYHIRAECIQVA